MKAYALTSNTPRTLEEIEALKESWLADPCWDIETTQGFELYRDKLTIFRLETDNKYLRAEVQKYQNAVAVFREVFATDGAETAR